MPAGSGLPGRRLLRALVARVRHDRLLRRGAQRRVPLNSARAAALVALLGFAPAIARAQPTNAVPVDLSWDAPSECPGHDAVIGEIARILGSSRGPRPHVSAQAAVSRAGGAWHAELDVATPDSQSHRSFDADTCDVLVSAAALIVAVAVDARLALGASPPPLTPPPAAPPPPTPPPPTPPPLTPAPPTVAATSKTLASGRPSKAARAAPARASVQGAQLEASAAFAGDLTTGPGAAPGGEVAVGWSQTGVRWRIRAFAGAQFFGPMDAVQRPYAATFRLTTVSGRACASLLARPIDVGPCIGADVDVMSVSNVRGPARFTPHQEDGRWVDVVGSILVGAALSERVSLFVRADGVVALAHPRFVVSSTELPRAVHQPSFVTGRGAVGIQVRFF